MSVLPGEIVNLGGLGKSKGLGLLGVLGKAGIGESGPRLTIGAYFYKCQFEEAVEKCVFKNGKIEAFSVGDWGIERECGNAPIAQTHNAVG